MDFLSLTFDSDIHALNLELYRELVYFFDTNATVQYCFQALDRFILNKIVIRDASAKFQEFVQDHVVGFIQSALRMIFILGWCPYMKKQVAVVGKNGKEEKIWVPSVAPLQYMRAELHVDKKTFEYKFKFWDENRMSPRTDIDVLVFDDISQLANGCLINSLMSGLIGEFRYAEQIKQFTIQAEYVRSNPSIYLRETKRGGGRELNGARGSGVMDSDGTMGEDVRNSIGLLNGPTFDPQAPNKPTHVQNLEKASEDIVANVEFHAAQMDRVAQGNQNYYRLGLNGQPQFMDNLFVCPPGMELASNPQMPESRVDQLTIMRNLQSMVFLKFGIPETVFGFIGAQTNNLTRGATTRGNRVRKDINIMDLNNFDATVCRYSAFVRKAFTQMYRTLYGRMIDPSIVLLEPPELYGLYLTHMREELLFGGPRGGRDGYGVNARNHKHLPAAAGDEGGEDDIDEGDEEDHAQTRKRGRGGDMGLFGSKAKRAAGALRDNVQNNGIERVYRRAHAAVRNLPK